MGRLGRTYLLANEKPRGRFVCESSKLGTGCTAGFAIQADTPSCHQSLVLHFGLLITASCFVARCLRGWNVRDRLPTFPQCSTWIALFLRLGGVGCGAYLECNGELMAKAG
jgi:hypothetical protein